MNRSAQDDLSTFYPFHMNKTRLINPRHIRPKEKWINRILHGIHGLICGFVVFGWIMPNSYVIYHISFCMLMILGWQILNGRCILTILSHHSSQSHRSSSTRTDHRPFIKDLILWICPKRAHLISDLVLKIMLYGIILLSMMLSARKWLTNSQSTNGNRVLTYHQTLGE